ncbi:MAG: potassium/proton antiporter [Mycobacteriaceae bacterium]
MQLEYVLGGGALVLLVGVLGVRASSRIGMPALLLFLAIGLFIGEAGLGLRFSDARLTEELGMAALVLILTEGGLSTRWRAVRPALNLGIALSTVSVVVSIAIVGAAVHLLLGLDWRIALLWGAVLSSTDAAAVFSVLRNLAVRRRLVGALELESGMNDAPVVIAVSLLASSDPIAWWTPAMVIYELGVAAAAGALLGLGGAWALRRIALPSTGLYPLSAVAVCVLSFSAGQLLHASGLLATYVCALVLGNARLPHRQATLSFAEGTGWLAQIGLFVLLGLYVAPARLSGAIVDALVIGLVLLFVARPLSVVAAALPLRIPWREQAFLSFSGLRGAVPIVLATIPLVNGVVGAERLLDVVFVLVVVFTLVQGTSLPWVARWLKVTVTGEMQEVSVDAAPLENMHADLLQVQIPTGSRLHGVYLGELRLPKGATVSLIVRDGDGFTPDTGTRLRRGDQILVVTTTGVRDATEARIRAIDAGGRLARWRGVTGRP